MFTFLLLSLLPVAGAYMLLKGSEKSQATAFSAETPERIREAVQRAKTEGNSVRVIHGGENDAPFVVISVEAP